MQEMEVKDSKLYSVATNDDVAYKAISKIETRVSKEMNEAKDELKQVQDTHKVMLAKLVKRVAVR